MSRNLSPVLTLAFVNAFTACSTPAPVQSLAELPALTAASTGVAIPVRTEVDEGYAEVGECGFEVRNLETMKLYKLSFKSGVDMIFADLPPATYSFKDMNCGAGWANLTFRDWPAFTVYLGKVSLTGGIHLVKHSRRRVSITRVKREETRERSIAFFDKLPTEARSRVVSAYGGTPIDPARLAHPAREKKWLATDASGKSIPGKSELRDFFHHCYRNEYDRNALWLGDLEVDAEFRDSRLVIFQAPESWNTFTPDFRLCIEARLKEFHPASPETRRYTLYL